MRTVRTLAVLGHHRARSCLVALRPSSSLFYFIDFVDELERMARVGVGGSARPRCWP